METLQQEFESAVEEVRKKNGIDVESQLLLYGLYKQATIGDCEQSCPAMWKMEAMAKWRAWIDRKGLSKNDAMQAYVVLAQNLSSSNTQALGGRSVSTLVQTDEEEIEDHASAIVRAARSGDLASVEAILASDQSASHCLDTERRTPLHWSADRGRIIHNQNTNKLRSLLITGHFHICAKLIQAGAEINAQDLGGLTPLAYAVTCEHPDIITLLIQAGADPLISDEDGDTPFSIASPDIIPLLQRRVLSSSSENSSR
uniref:ACB domain-containing protein n=1 Tax=Aureoumbra lagunensis TaxID=44058 RepID=A0A7S3JW28_9STRA